MYAQIALVLWTCAIFNIFEKLTCACFSQIALETILLAIHIICHKLNYNVITRQGAFYYIKSMLYYKYFKTQDELMG